MNDEQACIMRLYQYLLAKEDFLKQALIKKHTILCRKNPTSDDILRFWVAMIKYDAWEEIAGEVWKLLR